MVTPLSCTDNKSHDHVYTIVISIYLSCILRLYSEQSVDSQTSVKLTVCCSPLVVNKLFLSYVSIRSDVSLALLHVYQWNWNIIESPFTLLLRP